MSAGKAFWTSGVKDSNVASGWKWSSGEEWNYTNWNTKKGEPNNYKWPWTGNLGENCVMINYNYGSLLGGVAYSMFNDLLCDKRIGFICQKGNYVQI